LAVRIGSNNRYCVGLYMYQYPWLHYLCEHLVHFFCMLIFVSKYSRFFSFHS
jgi:hypothetical protein